VGLAFSRASLAGNHYGMNVITPEIDLVGEREPDGSLKRGLGLQFSLPLFDRGDARRQMAAGGVNLALSSQADATARVEQELYTLLAQLGSAERRILQLERETIPRRQQMLELGLREYNFMLADAFSLLNLKQ